MEKPVTFVCCAFLCFLGRLTLILFYKVILLQVNLLLVTLHIDSTLITFSVYIPFQWLNLFGDMLSLLALGPYAVDIYLRVLLALDEEVVARHIPHTQLVSV